MSAFVADALGDYVIQLTVADSQNHCSSDTVTASFGNVRPVANAGKSMAVIVGETASLIVNRAQFKYRHFHANEDYHGFIRIGGGDSSIG